MPTWTVPATILLNGTKAPTVTLFVRVEGVRIAVAVPALIEPVAPAVKISAFKTILEFVVEMLLLPIASVPPAPVLRVTPAGPVTLPFSVMSVELLKVTVPLLALALKFTARVLFKLILPAPPEMLALKVPELVFIAVPADPMLPFAEVRLTVPAAPTSILPAAALLMSLPVFTLTVLPVAVMMALFVNVPVPVLKKFKLPVVVRLAPTVMLPV